MEFLKILGICLVILTVVSYIFGLFSDALEKATTIRERKERVQYVQLQKQQRLVPCTTVKITEKCESFERGWLGIWNEPMDNCVGLIGEITEVDNQYGIRVKTPNGINRLYPYFVLEVV